MNWSGCTLTVEIAPDDTLFTASPTWTDISDDVHSIPQMVRSGRSSLVDRFNPGALTVEVSDRDRSYDPSYGPAAVVFDGTASNYFDCGDIAAFGGTTQLDIRFAIALDDVTPAANMSIVGQWGAAGNRSWRVFYDTSGYVNFAYTNDGTTITDGVSGAVPTGVAGQVVCVRVIRSLNYVGVDVKRVPKSFAKAACQSDEDWINVGIDTSLGSTATYNSTSGVRIGALHDGSEPLDGKIYYLQVANVLYDAPDVVFDPSDAASTAATSWTSSATGETWTGTGSAYDLLAQSTYYGRLGPGTPIRVRATYNAVTYDRWYGYVRRVEQVWPGKGKHSMVRIQATTGRAWLNDIVAPATPFGIEVAATLGTDAVAYWPLHEPLTSRFVTDSVGSSHGEWSSLTEAGGPSQPSTTLPTRLLAEGVYLNGTVQPVNSASAYKALWAMVYIPDSSATFRIVLGDDAGQLGLSYGVGGNYLIQASRSGVDDGSTFEERLGVGSHLIYLVDNDFVADGCDLLVDGTQIAETVYNNGLQLIDITNTVGLYVDGVGATVSDVAVSKNVQTAAEIRALLNTARTGRAGETAGSRMTWLLTAAGVPTGLQTITTDTSTYLGASNAGGTYGSLTEEVATAEAGMFYDDAAGDFVFRSRLWPITASAAITSQATFSDTYADIAMQPADWSDVVNEATVTLPSGAFGLHRDEESIGHYGRRSVAYSAPCRSPGAAEALARHYVKLKAHPGPRVSSVSFMPRRNPSLLFPAVLGLDIGERFTITRDVSGTLNGATATDPITVDVVVQGISEQVGADGTWTTTFTTAPAPLTASEAGYFTFDDSVLGRFDAGLSFAP